MIQYRTSVELTECEHIWRKMWPETCLFDLWPVRSCFASAYKSTPYFIIAEDHGETVGLLALSKVAESDCYGFYPAETWQRKTWLERNRIPASSPEVLLGLLEAIPEKTHLRYMDNSVAVTADFPLMVDELNYQFFPGRVNYSFENYLGLYPGKSRKKILKETEVLQGHGVSYHLNNFDDIEYMFEMNQANFGESSYFADPRFVKAFTMLSEWLRDRGMLRVTTLKLGGRIAAIDLGAVWRNNYTVMAGCTNSEFLGVAKLINLHHLETACKEKMASVDFLCGDFNWKRRFRLTETPLFQMNILPSWRGQQRINESAVTVAASGY